MAPNAKSGMATRSSLSPGYGDAVLVGQEAQGEGADLEGEVGEVRLAGRADDPQRHAVDVDRLGDLERPDHERHQVGGHDHRVGEARRGARPSPVGSAATSAALEMAARSSATTSVTPKTALNAGSSQHGKARRAWVASNWVVARVRVVAVVVGERRAVEADELVVEDAGERACSVHGPAARCPTGRW